MKYHLGLLNAHTLNRYFAALFVKVLLSIFGFCAVLVFLLDFSELLRRTSSLPDVSGSVVFLLSLMRTPSIMEQILPFTVLIAAMMTFFMLSKRLELVVARGAGISVWQFLMPSFIVAIVIGIVATTLANPGIGYLNGKALALEAGIFKKDAKLLTGQTSSVWLRKTGRSEDVIIGAARALDQGTNLIGVTMIRQSRQGRLIQRIDADSAVLDGNRWILANATITGIDVTRRFLASYSIVLDLTPEEVRNGFGKAQQRSFWSLPELIEKARIADLPTHRYSLQFNTLLAQPIFFMAMVVIAATVSLRFMRSGNVSGLVVGGITAGFVLYILRSLAEDLGNSGLVQPLLAAWLPALIALVFGFTWLLYQEDG